MEFSDRADGDLKCKFLDTLETLHMIPFLKKAQKRIWDSIPDQKKCHERVGVNIWCIRIIFSHIVKREAISSDTIE